MLNFHQSLPFLNWLFPLLPIPQTFPARISDKIFLQTFPTRFLRKIFPQDFPADISCKNFPQDFPARLSHKIFKSWILIGWLPIALFQMLNFHQSLPFLDWLFAPPPCPTRFSHKIFCKNFPQDFPTRIFRKIFPQDFPKLDPDWLAPHCPIPNAKFPPITAFLRLAFCPSSLSCKNFPQDFHSNISHKIFLQTFPTRFSCKIFPSWILIGWLPIALFQMLNFHQSPPS